MSDEKAAWEAVSFLGLPTPTYTAAEQAEIERLEAELSAHMADRKPRRHAHSLSVARMAEGLAARYGVDPFCARAAGILHDWHKVYSADEQVAQARALGLDLGVDLALVANVIHGMLTARELPGRFPELPGEIWQAIDRHTTGAPDMSPLDMVVFVADIIEPLRPDVPSVCHARKLVEEGAPLKQVYWEAFRRGIVYVIETGRYLWPGTLDTYNRGVLEGVDVPWSCETR